MSGQQLANELRLDQRSECGPASEQALDVTLEDAALHFATSGNDSVQLEGHLQRSKEHDSDGTNEASISLLPNEILSDIFTHVCQDSNPIELSPAGGKLFQATDPLYILGLVCSGWAALSQSTAVLWTHLHYNLASGGVEAWARLMAVGDRLLARSHNSPLCIRFTLLGGYSARLLSEASAARAAYPHIFDALTSSTIRWKELSANPRCIMLLQEIGIIPATLPNITLLNMRHPFKVVLHLHDTVPFVNPIDLPRASTLRLINNIKKNNPPSINYDFLKAPNITHVELVEFTESRFMLPMLTGYHLHTLTLTLASNPNYSYILRRPTPWGVLLFPVLRTLNVLVDSAQRHGIPWLFMGLACPSLTSLGLYSGDKNGGSHITADLSQFLSRSGCQLSRLTLSNFTPIDIITELESKAMDSLSELNIKVPELWMDAFNALILRLPHGLPKCCRLQLLCIRANALKSWPKYNGQPLSLEALVELRERGIWKSETGSAALIRLELHLDDIQMDTRKKLQEHCEATSHLPVRMSVADRPNHWRDHYIDDPVDGVYF
jgi:F-box-like